MHSSNYHYRNLLRIGVKKAGQRFGPQEKVHGFEASAPLVTGNAIAITLTMDVTMKGRGRVKAATSLCNPRALLYWPCPAAGAPHPQ